MAQNRPADLTEHPAPPFPPHSPKPEHEAKLSRRASSISRAENAIKEMFFGGAKVNKHAVDEHVHVVQQQDADFHARITTPHESSVTELASAEVYQRSPSIEARKADTTNQNGFSDDKQFGWPGLGDLQNVSSANEQKKTTKPPQARKMKSMEAAVNEAIDEGADESYGWAGLGSWSPSKRD